MADPRPGRYGGAHAYADRGSRRHPGLNTTAGSYNAGLTLSFPLFTGFANQAANRQAQAAVDTAQASAEQLLQTVELEVWQAYQNLVTAASSIDTTETGLKSAQEAADVTNARYKGGLGSILDVLNAQATLANARVQEVQARLNWFAALAAMGHAVGGLNAPPDNPELP
ncbi:MAG TPA: TolC family protein [Gammaproteobacteria bacterium]|nr:TolC family protein [Gammaproteobacteria bacterium]